METRRDDLIYPLDRTVVRVAAIVEVGRAAGVPRLPPDANVGVFADDAAAPRAPAALFLLEQKISMYGVDDPDVVQIGSPENYHATDSD